MNIHPGYMVRSPMAVPMVPIAVPMSSAAGVGHAAAVQQVPYVSIAGLPQQVSATPQAVVGSLAQQFQPAGHTLTPQPGLIPSQLHPTLLPSYATLAGQNISPGLIGHTPTLLSPFPQAISPYAGSFITPQLAQHSLLIGSPMQARLPFQHPLVAPTYLTAEQLQAAQELQMSVIDPAMYQATAGSVQIPQVIEKTKAELEVESKPFILDEFNSDLSLVISDDGYEAHALTNPEGFCFCWSGVRATQGVMRGKVYYEVHITEHLLVSFPPDHQETDPHIVRVGWSVDSASTQLGEEDYSYGYGGTGKFSVKCKFTDYGNRFGAGDVIGALLDLDSKPPNISYMKNGKWLTVAHNLKGFPVGQPDMALFPHVLSKNCRFKVNFGQRVAFFDPPPGFTFVNQAPAANRVLGLQPPKRISDCEIIMIVGLPGCGKTTWAQKMLKENPDKRYCIIGTDALIDKMKVNGLARKRNYAGRWDILIDKATKCLNKFFLIGSKRHRNYILDQTNVYPSAQMRKMKHFKGFKRKAAVIVTEDQELIRRSNKRSDEDGKIVPESAVREMKLNFKLPSTEDGFLDEVMYIELPKERASVIVELYNRESKKAHLAKALPSVPVRPPNMYNLYKQPSVRQPWNQGSSIPNSQLYGIGTGLDSIKKEYTHTTQPCRNNSSINWARGPTSQVLMTSASTYSTYSPYNNLPLQSQSPFGPIVKQDVPSPNVISTWSASQDWQVKTTPSNVRLQPPNLPIPSIAKQQPGWNVWNEIRHPMTPSDQHGRMANPGLNVAQHSPLGISSSASTLEQPSTHGGKHIRTPSPSEDAPPNKQSCVPKIERPGEADSTGVSNEQNKLPITGGGGMSNRLCMKHDEFADNADAPWMQEPDSRGDGHIPDDKQNSINQADSTTDPSFMNPSLSRGRGPGVFRAGRPPFRGDARFRPFGPPPFPPNVPPGRMAGHPRNLPPRRGFAPLPRFGPPPPPMGGPLGSLEIWADLDSHDPWDHEDRGFNTQSDSCHCYTFNLVDSNINCTYKVNVVDV